MSDRIRGGRPPTTPELPRAAGESAKSDATQKTPGGATTQPQEGAEDAPVDKFERSVKVGVQLENRLQALAGKTPLGKIQFSNEDIASLAATLASIIKQNSGADRAKRARLFAKAVLKRKKLRKVFSGVPEAEMEQMCDIIGDVLDSSPVFGQLVDNVTEGAGKLNAG